MAGDTARQNRAGERANERTALARGNATHSSGIRARGLREVGAPREK